MITYYIALVFILVFGLVFYCGLEENSAKKLFLLLSFSCLFVLMAIRADTVGTDIDIYRNKFQIIAAANTWEKIVGAVDNAPVYCLLNKAVSLFGNYRLMMVVISFIIMFSVAEYIYHFSDNVVISTYCFVSLFFYLHAFNISRQFLAIAFFLLALCFRKKGRVVLCLVFFLLAIGVHSLAFVALPLLLIDRERISTKKFTIYMLIATIGVLLVTVCLPRVIGLFVSLFPRYQVYLGKSIHSVFDRSSGAIVFLALFYLLVTVLAIVLQSNIIDGVYMEFEERSHLRYLIIGVTAGALMGILAGGLEAMARILYFYQIHTICLIPNAFGKLQQYRFYYPLYYALLLILLVPFTICLLRNFGEVVPYIPMWR